jgi:hypothetical protein
MRFSAARRPWEKPVLSSFPKTAAVVRLAKKEGKALTWRFTSGLGTTLIALIVFVGMLMTGWAYLAAGLIVLVISSYVDSHPAISAIVYSNAAGPIIIGLEIGCAALAAAVAALIWRRICRP